MKKLVALLLVVVLVVPNVVSAIAYDDGIRVILDGVELEFDVPPMIIDNHTMVPMRVIFEALGWEVEWTGWSQRIDAMAGEKAILMFVGNSEMQIGTMEYFVLRDGRPPGWDGFRDVGAPFLEFDRQRGVLLGVPPQIVDNRTFVPLRAISEALNADVDWCGNTRIVTIMSAEWLSGARAC